MTTNVLKGYMARRDGAGIGKFGLETAVSYDEATAMIVSADDQRSFMSLSEIGGPTDVSFGDVLDLRIDEASILDPDGSLRDDLTIYVSEVFYRDGTEKSLIELGIFETGGDTGWFFTLAGDQPSYRLDRLRSVNDYDAAMIRLGVPDGRFSPGSPIFIDSINVARTSDDDFFNGTPLDDVVNLGIGRDELRGAAGNDSLSGGEGNDRLFGDGGNDTLLGGDDDDRLLGGDGDDLLLGGDARDTLLGNDGNDNLNGGSRRDLLNGGDGNDTLDGGDNNDVLFGGAGLADVGTLNRPLQNFGSGAAVGGWNSQDRTPRLLGDIDGDGAADIVGFGGPRTFSALNDGAGGFAGLAGAVNNFAQAQGWKTQDGQTRLLGDVDGDGDDDIIGFGFKLGFVAFSNGDGTFSGFQQAVSNFANAQGWKSDDSTPRILGDVNGDGIADIIGFGFRSTFTALGQGDGSFGPVMRALDNFSQAQGWATNAAFLRLSGDVDGDGQDDIVGFGSRATFVALSNGDGTFAAARAATDDLSAAKGWGDNNATPRALGDVDGDGRDDIVGFGGQKTFAALARADGSFGPVETLTEDFNRATGWTSQDRLPRMMADLDRDGDDDLVGFSGLGVLTRMVIPESDTFVFSSGGSDDVVADFDMLDLLDMRGTNLSAGQALAAATQNGADVRIAYDGGSVTLENFDLANLSLDNFL